jgi:hypothetical protein
LRRCARIQRQAREPGDAGDSDGIDGHEQSGVLAGDDSTARSSQRGAKNVPQAAF